MDLNLQSIELVNRLRKLELEQSSTSQKTNTAIILCRKQLSCFQKIILNTSFSKISYEIDFFKITKQVPLHNLIYYSEVRSIELHYPRLNKKKQMIFIRQKMEKVNRFYQNNIDFIQYIEMGKTHLDEQYFTRKYFNENLIIHTKFYFLNSDYNTSHDLLLAKLKANQKLSKYLHLKLITLESSKLNINFSNTTLQKKLYWTSSKVALTELIYALKYSGAINSGSADIKEIAIALQNIFNLDIGDFYRIFLEIRARKKSKAKFLDELSTTFINKLESEDE